jgi:hypothetical protein
MPLHGFLEELQRGLPVARVGDDAFEHFTLVIDSPPEVVRHAGDLHLDLVEVPLPVAMGTHRLEPLAADLAGEHRAEPVPPVAHRLVADLDAPLVQQVLDVAKRSGCRASPPGG